MIEADAQTRDLFAGLAMQTLLADRSRNTSVAALAAHAFVIADAMLAARGTAQPAPQATKPARQGAKAT